MVGRRFSEAGQARGRPNSERVHRLCHVVHTHDVRAALHRRQCSRHAGSQTVSHAFAGEHPQRGFSAPTHKQRMPNRQQAVLPS